ncbi:hypothetical protein QTH89_01530 [Variovorax sp. J22G21]|uniref:hypothetical protein n=1 Tax=Variovorax fucosicus TaxID=3053517 RepID=UPI00257891BE|nr:MULTISPECIES: hypothetical protein [unclassified Variovorax]MDM0042108.1 hypothetical protein [Variovorax sp. J22R193]MDM0059878.1 hypothetical protein [Variovorax sp. J22G21]
MDINALMESLASSRLDVPAELGILELRRASIDELQRRLRKFLKAGGEACDRNLDRGQWTTHEDRTLVRLPQGAHAVVYHASGAVKLAAGLAPMEWMFKEIESREALTGRAEGFVKLLGLHDNLGRGETLAFERLWQIKASAADRSGKAIAPVLCRAVGAFRQHIDGVPVLGPASVAVQIAAEGVLDSLSLLMRSPSGEVFEKAKVLHPERALRQIGQQLAARFGQAKGEVSVESRDGLRFGYLSLPKRKSQRLLAPVYMATIEVAHALERQAFVMVVPATEKSYLPLDLPGAESLIGQTGKLGARRCCC